MPNYPGGAPYPLPAAAVNAGADDIARLAAFVDPAEIVTYRSTGVNVPTATWTAPPAWSGVTYTKGGGLTSGGTGIAVAKAGRYRCEAAGSFPVNATGARRGIGVGLASAAGPIDPWDMRSPTTSGVLAVTISVTITAAAGDVLTLFYYQDSGGTLVVTGANLSVKRET